MVTDTINSSLTTRQKEFAMSMFVDSRLTQDLFMTRKREPSNMDEALALMEKYRDNLGAVVRTERPDLITLAIALENTDDMLERVAIWASQYTPTRQ